jgi:hypothetical protein
MLSTIVVLLSLTAIDPVMRWAPRLSAGAFPQHDPVVAIPILFAVAAAALALVSVLVKSWAHGVSMRAYFADATPPTNP